MKFFDIFFKKNKEERSQQHADSDHLEAKYQSSTKKSDGQTQQFEPFIFKSDCHQRYENGVPKMGLQKCFRTISVEKNTNGCNGYRLEPGIGYIVKVFNDDLGMPNMSDKPMKVVRKTENSVELRGFPIEAMSPFGWQEVDYSVYGFVVYYEHGEVRKCILHMYDRNIQIEYRTTSNRGTTHISTNTNITNNNISVKDVAKGNPFNIKFTSIQVVKQSYNGQNQNISVSSSVTSSIYRSTMNGVVNFDIGNISELHAHGILQSNPSLYL